MIYKIFITSGGVPRTGLTPAWQSLRTTGGADKSASAPAIGEIGDGWYKFEVHCGVAPFDVPELVGLIDTGAALADGERYIPVTISLRDLALAKLVNKATYDLVEGIETIRNDADSANELRIALTQTGNLETRTIQ